MKVDSPCWGLEAEAVESGTHVRFTGELVHLDGQNSQILGDPVSALIEEGGSNRLILDFANVDYVTGSALARLILLHQRLQARGGWLTLINVPPLVYEVFEITRLTKYLDVRRTGEALTERWPRVQEPVII